MDIRSNSTGDFIFSTANRANRHGNTNHRHNNNTNHAKKKNVTPAYVSINNNKVKVVVVYDLGLDPRSVQELEKLEREVISYAQSTMNADAANSLVNAQLCYITSR